MEAVSNRPIPLYTPEDLKRISDSLEEKTPEQILQWAVDSFGSNLTMATAFGAEGCVILAMLAESVSNGRAVRLFNLNTGYQFSETLAVRDRFHEKYGLEIELVGAKESVAEMEVRHGGPIYGTNPDECCRQRKLVPLRDALGGYAAWISAIRRDQTPDRATASIVEWDKKYNLVKVNPLANWTKRDVWKYILAHEVPYNPLHDLGFPSIGCQPCTRAVGVGEDDRSGRWANFAKTECGLHTRTS